MSSIITPRDCKGGSGACCCCGSVDSNDPRGLGLQLSVSSPAISDMDSDINMDTIDPAPGNVIGEQKPLHDDQPCQDEDQPKPEFEPMLTDDDKQEGKKNNEKQEPAAQQAEPTADDQPHAKVHAEFAEATSAEEPMRTVPEEEASKADEEIKAAKERPARPKRGPKPPVQIDGTKPPEQERRLTRRALKQDAKQPEEEEKKELPAEEGAQAEEADAAKAEEGEDQGLSKKRGRATVKKEVNDQGNKPQEANQAAPRQAAKRQRKTATSAASPEKRGAADREEDKASSHPHPGSPEYEALSKEEKEEALMAAIDAHEKSTEALRASSQAVGAHISSWFTHPFQGSQDARLVKSMKRVSEKRDASAITKPAKKAAELWTLWKKLFSLDPATTASLQEQHGGKTLTAQDLATFYASKQGQQGPTDVSKAPAAAAAPKTITVNDNTSKVKPTEVAAPPSTAPPPEQGPPAATPQQVPLASFCSTGDSARDKTIAALFQALFSASSGAFDLLQLAVKAEKSLFETSHEPQGQSASYVRRSFLLWSLIAPDSEHHDEEVRRRLMQGQTPETILASVTS